MRLSSIHLFSLVLVLILTVSACKPDPCEDAVCAPCPSSRFVIQYQDSTGACPASFHSSAMVYGIRMDNMMDTVYSYNFSDSCMVGFLVQEDLEYHVVAMGGAYTDIVQINDFEYQEPLAITECCFCYPVQRVNVSINGDTSSVVFPEGDYDSTPFVISLN